MLYLPVINVDLDSFEGCPKPMLSFYCSSRQDDDDMPQNPTHTRLAQVHPRRIMNSKIISASPRKVISDKTLRVKGPRKLRAQAQLKGISGIRNTVLRNPHLQGVGCWVQGLRACFPKGHEQLSSRVRGAFGESAVLNETSLGVHASAGEKPFKECVSLCGWLCD